ncbi:MAG: hypothetical protein AAGI45_08465 [Cyanobacteria bacterium P01_H01_bin.26]
MGHTVSYGGWLFSYASIHTFSIGVKGRFGGKGVVAVDHHQLSAIPVANNH